MKKRLFCIMLSLVMTVTAAMPVLADQESDLEAAKNANQNALSSTSQQLGDAQNAQSALKSEISNLDSQLVTLISNIDVLKGDISSTETQIKEKGVELTKAEADRDNQYTDMETRIQYIYENGGETNLAYILQAKDLTELLNRADYAEKLQKYDRDLLAEFVSTVNQVAEIKDNLESTKSELQEEQQNLESQQSDLSKKLDEKKATSSNYDTEIAKLTAKAADLTASIDAQNAQIKQIRAEKAAAAKAAAEAAAAKAAQQAAAAVKQETAAAAKDTDQGTSSKSSDADTAQTNTDSKDTQTPSQDTADNQDTNDDGGQTADDTQDDGGTANVPASSIGQAAADYACQFIGNPYVWGGESLTNGCDCSGFVMAVYAHFGIDLPHSSGDLAGVGTGVSYSDAQPGDIICYSGHVGIYVGDDTIVNASNERDGIKYTSPATYRTIVAVRRVG